MPREACGLNVSEAEPALAREALEVDDARQRNGVAAVLGAVDGVRMDECNLEAEEAGARLLVDELSPAVGEVAQGRGEIVDLVGDVVHAGPALGEELADGRLLPEGTHQLDPALTHSHGHCLDALVLERAAMLDAAAEQSLVGADRLVEILDRDSQMVDPKGLHGPDATYACSSCGAGCGSTRTVPTVSLDRDSASTSESRVARSSRCSVSFSSSAPATRSSGERCFSSRRIASSYAPSVRRACSLSRRRLVSSESA